MTKTAAKKKVPKAPPDPTGMVRVITRVSPVTKRKLEREAAKQERSSMWLQRHIIETYLENPPS